MRRVPQELSLRFVLGSRESELGKRDDILERQSLVFIQYSGKYLGTAKETERTFGLPRG